MFQRNAHPIAHRLLPPIAAGLIAALAMLRAPAQAEPRQYVIDDGEGYGVVDCFVEGVACGRIVADGWCEAHGGGPAAAYGLASDVTGSIAASAPRPTRAGSVVITCQD